MTAWKHPPHQYIERSTGKVCDERLMGDEAVSFLYGYARENAPRLFRALTGARVSSLLGFLHYDLGARPLRAREILSLASRGFAPWEWLDDPRQFRTMRDVFERKIRYWEYRPLPDDPRAVTSPADARMLVGSFRRASRVFLKEKLFDYEQLIGLEKRDWLNAFQHGDFAVFRLTPDKYHYNHTPVAGTVLDIYEIPGLYHSCNPGAVVVEVTPHSKNKRVVTVIDTDTDGGTQVGLVAMLEVVALMIGEVTQCYSEERYDDPREVLPGMLLGKGRPKSLYRPGSSTDLLIFQKGRVRFDEDLLRNQHRVDIASRFSLGFGRVMVETDVKARSRIATAVSGA